MQLAFVTVDVFTPRRFGGNPLAVVLDAAELQTAQMQAIAAEFNLSETTFVLPPKDPTHTAEVRIFTPKAELPFAGHPNVGTAFVLAMLGRTAGDRLVFEEKAGLVPIELLRDGARDVRPRLTAPQPFTRGADVPADLLAAACGLDPGDIATSRHLPCVASCGTPFIFAELKGRDALAAAQPRPEVFARNFPIDGATGIHLYIEDGGSLAEDGGEYHLRARMFAPLHGVSEDPATGSANVALVGLVSSQMPEAAGTLYLRIGQGIEMGRPSLLEASAEKRDGRVVTTHIAGNCVPVMRGTIEV
jgi:trans-2,3-dihydro-3-hydroxyanthranilate isomerase